KLRSVGAANCFHADPFREPDESRWCRDDQETRTIDFPNYHSGSNGDAQPVSPVEPLHPLLMRAGGGRIEWLPSHPHEGAVVAPPVHAAAGRVAGGGTPPPGRPFTLAIASERSDDSPGRGVAESSFPHFADYNWTPAVGAPSFVTEKPGSGLKENPTALEHTR